MFFNFIGLAFFISLYLSQYYISSVRYFYEIGFIFIFIFNFFFFNHVYKFYVIIITTSITLKDLHIILKIFNENFLNKYNGNTIGNNNYNKIIIYNILIFLEIIIHNAFKKIKTQFIRQNKELSW